MAGNGILSILLWCRIVELALFKGKARSLRSTPSRDTVSSTPCYVREEERSRTVADVFEYRTLP